MAQTFTAGRSGQIDKVSLSLETHSNLAIGWLEIRAAYWWGTTFNSYRAGQQWLSCQGCA